MMHVRTKIICTIGPSVLSYDKILELMHAGMDVARLNFSHGNHAQHKEVISLLKKAREELKKPLAIMLDSKGPEIRIRAVQGGQLLLKEGDVLPLLKEQKEGSLAGISVHPASVIDELEVGERLLFDDGYIQANVIEKSKGSIKVKILNSGLLKSGKKINVPSGRITLPAMTQEDIDDFTFGCEQDVDAIAASFVRSAENVLEIRKFIKSKGKKEILIISKIENVEGVKNFDSILQVSDGIMVARGDLGVELPLYQVPQLQKMMIKKCNLEGKIVVTATQMLESMINCPRPTRAEVSDVANAIYDSTSCVMLSGETAAGKYPIETTKMMRSVVEEAEKDFDYEGYDRAHHSRNYNDTSSSIALATVKTAYKSSAKAIFTYTSSGFTSRNISKFRPKIPIISITNCKKTFHQLSLVWGAVAVLKECHTEEHAFAAATCYALTHGYVQYGDRVFVTAGSPFGVRGTTNMMMIRNIGDVLVRGHPSKGKNVYGQASILLTFHEKIDVKQKIAVITHCEPKYEEFLSVAKGIVLQNFEEDTESEECLKEIAEKYHIPFLFRAESATTLIKEGEMVTLAPSKGVVFKGEMEAEEDVIKEACKL
jgi:pyruvate kinase